MDFQVNGRGKVKVKELESGQAFYADHTPKKIYILFKLHSSYFPDHYNWGVYALEVDSGLICKYSSDGECLVNVVTYTLKG